jgi:TRAP-type C4-dicarboxylate transport system permease small subunit
MLLTTYLSAVTIDLTRHAQEQGLINSSDTAALFPAFIGNVLRVLMVVAAVAALVMMVWGAFEWVVSGGEKGKIEAARNKITGAVVGILVLASVVAIFNLLQQFLDVQIFP